MPCVNVSVAVIGSLSPAAHVQYHRLVINDQSKFCVLIHALFQDDLIPSMKEYISKIQAQSDRLQAELDECDELMGQIDAGKYYPLLSC